MHNRIPRQYLDLLGAVPLFSACSQSDLRAIAKLGTPIKVDEDTYLTTRGEPGREFFLVLDGVASCRIGKREVKRFTTGGYFGELALLTGGVRTADVVAVTPMEVLVLDAREFRSLLATSPKVAMKMLVNLAERLTIADAQYTH